MPLPISVAPRLLEGRLALVTGAGQGNGRALALGLAQAGAHVIVTRKRIPHISWEPADEPS